MESKLRLYIEYKGNLRIHVFKMRSSLHQLLEAP